MLNKLIIINIILFICAYFFVEKPALESQLKNRSNKFVFSNNDLQRNISIVANDFKISRKSDSIWSFGKEGHNPSQVKINKFIKRLGKLKIVRELPLSFDINAKCDFTLNDVHIIIGEKLLYNEHYYFQLGREKLIVHDTSPQTTPLTNELFRINPYKHKRLLDFCRSKKQAIISEKIFTNFALNNIEFRFLNQRPFFIDFQEMKTQPSPLGELNYLNKQFDVFKNKLKSTQVISYHDKSKGMNLSEIGWFTIDKEEKFKLFTSGQNLIVFSEKTKLWAKMKDHFLNEIFFQDFWDTRIFKSNAGNFCINGHNNSGFCLEFKNRIFNNLSNRSLNYPLWYDILYSLSSAAIFVRRAPSEFKYEYLLNFKGEKLMIKVRKNLITVVNPLSNIQYEFKRRNSMTELANI